ncbi:hypothetical protein D3C81_1950350 [compost metagenome]
MQQEGADHLVKQENDQEQKKATQVLSSVQKILDSGSEAAEWLRVELKKILEEEEA